MREIWRRKHQNHKLNIIELGNQNVMCKVYYYQSIQYIDQYIDTIDCKKFYFLFLFYFYIRFDFGNNEKL